MRTTGEDSEFDCPHCGSPVPAEAQRCRHCGASDECGWNDETAEWSGGGYAEEDDFDYDAWVEREFGKAPGSAGPKVHGLWILAVIGLLTMLVVLLGR